MKHDVTAKMFPSGKLASHAMVSGNPAAPPLILLHGAGPGASASSNWRYCIGDLSEDFYVVAPDLVGFGQSEYPDPLPALDYLEENRARVVERLGRYRGEKLWGSNINFTVFPNLQFSPVSTGCAAITRAGPAGSSSGPGRSSSRPCPTR